MAKANTCHHWDRGDLPVLCLSSRRNLTSAEASTIFNTQCPASNYKEYFNMLRNMNKCLKSREKLDNSSRSLDNSNIEVIRQGT